MIHTNNSDLYSFSFSTERYLGDIELYLVVHEITFFAFNRFLIKLLRNSCNYIKIQVT